MSNALISLIALAIMLTSVLAVFNTIFASNRQTSIALLQQDLSVAREVHARVVATTVAISGDAVRTNVDVTVSNRGKVEYGDLSEWNINVEYIDSSNRLEIKRLAYSDIAADNRWMLQAIYRNAAALTPEFVDPNVFNADEEMVVRLRVNPPVLAGSTGRVVLTPPTGRPTSIFFTG